MKLKNVSILVVDDEQELREIYGDYFRDEGAEIFEAESGNKALALLSSQIIDIIFSDVRMPDGDGIFLLKHVRPELKKNPFMFMCTGHAATQIDELKSLGAAEVFVKPFVAETVISVIANVMLNNSGGSVP